jgi:hypothetical protein
MVAPSSSDPPKPSLTNHTLLGKHPFCWKTSVLLPSIRNPAFLIKLIGKFEFKRAEKGKETISQVNSASIVWHIYEIEATEAGSFPPIFNSMAS